MLLVRCDGRWVYNVVQKKEKWTLLRFLIWEMDHLVSQDTFTPKNSVPHKFGLTVLYGKGIWQYCAQQILGHL